VISDGKAIATNIISSGTNHTCRYDWFMCIHHRENYKVKGCPLPNSPSHWLLLVSSELGYNINLNKVRPSEVETLCMATSDHHCCLRPQSHPPPPSHVLTQPQPIHHTFGNVNGLNVCVTSAVFCSAIHLETTMVLNVKSNRMACAVPIFQI
jgi:hypothetical protein